MHQSAFDFVQRVVNALPRRQSVLEFGARNVNGSVRKLFAGAQKYVGVDELEGPGVDVVCAAQDFDAAGHRFDTVVSTETIEHTPHGAAIFHKAYHCLADRGVFIVTCAAPGRGAHSAIDGGELRAGEYYWNPTESELREWLSSFRPVLLDMLTNAGDSYILAWKGGHS